MMKIFLDDVRDPYPGWTLAKSHREAVELLTTHRNEVTHISFDHDLGEGEPTGYDLAVDLEGTAAQGIWDLVPKNLAVHSANPVGRKNIQAAIDSIERMRKHV